MLDSDPLSIINEDIYFEASVKLLGIDTNNKSTFDNHISKVCRKTSNQLNAICRLQRCMGHSEKENIINSFVY